MKTLLLITALLFATPIAADIPPEQKPIVCTDLTVRLTAFALSANGAKSEEEYRSVWYRAISNGNADQSFRKVLLGLVDLAWQHRGEDVQDFAMKFYVGCARPTTNT